MNTEKLRELLHHMCGTIAMLCNDTEDAMERITKKLENVFQPPTDTASEQDPKPLPPTT